jgi:SAM-dependent methyltransferase
LLPVAQSAKLTRVSSSDSVFAGSVPELYDALLVPLIFEPYADDLAQRVAACQPTSVLETAAGTGVVTRALSKVLPPSCRIVATDLNQPMLDRAAAAGTARAVQWQAADAMQLPFDDASFDAVVCQFGVMFFGDKVHAYAEARRVLRGGGVFAFNTWDRIEDNEFGDVVTQALAKVFAGDPPHFIARTPHGYHDVQTIVRDLARAGFDAPPQIETVSTRCRAASPLIPAMAYCQGTPLRNEIEARCASQGTTLAEATAAAATAIGERFGEGAVEAKIQAHVVTVRA